MYTLKDINKAKIYAEKKNKYNVEVSSTIPKSMSWKGKAKDFPGAEEVIKQNGSK